MEGGCGCPNAQLGTQVDTCRHQGILAGDAHTFTTLKYYQLLCGGARRAGAGALREKPWVPQRLITMRTLDT